MDSNIILKPTIESPNPNYDTESQTKCDLLITETHNTVLKQQEELFNQIIQKIKSDISPKMLEALVTRNGNTQISERSYIPMIKKGLDELELTYDEAGSQQSKDFRNIGGISLNMECKKTDNNIIYFNDTCPTKDIWYLILFTGKQNKRNPENNIPAQILGINGEEFTEGHPWINDYQQEIDNIKDKYCRGEGKKNLPGIMEVYARPTYKANISKFLQKNID